MATAETEAPDQGARILVNGKPIKARRTQQVIWSTVAGVVIGLVAAGWYVGGTQVDWYVHLGWVYFHIFYNKEAWDVTAGQWLSQHTAGFITTKNWPDYRHSVFRNLAEPTAAGVVVMSLLAPRKYWNRRVGPVRMAVTMVLFIVTYLVLATGGTWLILFGESRWNPAGFSHGLWLVVQFGVLGLVISQVLHRMFGPVGAYFQGIWVEYAVDNHLRRNRPGVPWWVRLPLPPPVRERGQQQIDEDRTRPVNDDGTLGDSEATVLARKGVTWRSRIGYWLLLLVLPLILGLAFLGFVGHIIVGVLGWSFPYLFP